MASDNCLSCGDKITNKNNAVNCTGGVCDKAIHIDCAHLTKEQVKAVKECENIDYTCDICTSNSLVTLNNKINGLFDYLRRIEFKCDENEKTLNGVKDTVFCVYFKKVANE